MSLFRFGNAGENLVHYPRFQSVQFGFRFADDDPGSKELAGQEYRSEIQEQKCKSNTTGFQTEHGQTTRTGVAGAEKEHGKKSKDDPNHYDYGNRLEREPNGGDKTCECQ